MHSLCLLIYILIHNQVACALLMSGENLDNHADVKDILVEMGTYFQVQVNFSSYFFKWTCLLSLGNLWWVNRVLIQPMELFPLFRKSPLSILYYYWLYLYKHNVDMSMYSVEYQHVLALSWVLSLCMFILQFGEYLN